MAIRDMASYVGWFMCKQHMAHWSILALICRNTQKSVFYDTKKQNANKAEIWTWVKTEKSGCAHEKIKVFGSFKWVGVIFWDSSESIRNIANWINEE